MDAAAQVVFERLAWCAEAQCGLSGAFGDGGPEWVAAEVAAGRFELWKIDGGKIWMVTSVANGALVVECLQGGGLMSFAPVVFRIARKNGLRFIEFFTWRRGLSRMLQAYGFAPCETTATGTVYRCEVSQHG